jgi:hypothetical protein
MSLQTIQNMKTLVYSISGRYWYTKVFCFLVNFSLQVDLVSFKNKRLAAGISKEDNSLPKV